MKVTLASALMFMVALLALPGWAEEDRSQSPTLEEHLRQMPPIDVEEAARFLEQLYRRGIEILEDHLEVQGSFQPDSKGERGGHLSLKVYPKGKSHSDESMKAETWFRFFNKPEKEKDTLHFDFKFSREPKSTYSPQDYL